MADKPVNPKELAALQKKMKEYMAKSKKAPKVKKSEIAKIGNEIKGEKALLAKALKAINAAPDA